MSNYRKSETNDNCKNCKSYLQYSMIFMSYELKPIVWSIKDNVLGFWTDCVLGIVPKTDGECICDRHTLFTKK